jgi:hypothetical protein
MSHLTHIKTCFQNLFYLEKALNHLDIGFKKQKKIIENSTKSNFSLIIPQLNNYDIKFVWNGKEYEIIVDMSF